jgi:hypothetical protein
MVAPTTMMATPATSITVPTTSITSRYPVIRDWPHSKRVSGASVKTNLFARSGLLRQARIEQLAGCAIHLQAKEIAALDQLLKQIRLGKLPCGTVG